MSRNLGGFVVRGTGAFILQMSDIQSEGNKIGPENFPGPLDSVSQASFGTEKQTVAVQRFGNRIAAPTVKIFVGPSRSYPFPLKYL
jgi:hypothetical protein